MFASLWALVILFAYLSYIRDELIWTIVFGIIALYLLYGIVKGMRASLHPIIQREDIIEVKHIKEVMGLSPASFEIHFKDQSGQKKKRTILLYSSAPKYQNEVQHAVQVMTEEGFMRS